jgi:hypothetical protein
MVHGRRFQEGEAMKRKMIWLIVSLMFLSAMALVSAQSSVQIGPYGNLRIGPYGNLKIGPYGNLVGLTDAQGKDVLSQIREGFAIAYQLKNSKGGSEDRLVYALGDQFTSGLMVGKSTNSTKVVTTRDKALEIGRTLTWDEKSNTLKSHITITNIGTGEVAITGIEILTDERLLGALMGEQSALASALPDRVRAWIGTDCEICPIPPCGERCKRGQAKAVFRGPNSSQSASDDDLVTSRLPHFSGALFSLTWSASNLANATLGPGEKNSVYSWFDLGR